MSATPSSLVRYPVFLGMTRPALKFGITFGSFILLVMGTMLVFLATQSLWSPLLFVVGYGICYGLCSRDPRIFSMLRVRLWGTRGGASRFWGAKSYASFRPDLPRSVRRQLVHGAALGRERSAERFLPYAAMVDGHTVLLKNGAHLQVLQLEGLAFETRDAEELAHRTQVLNTLFRSLGPNLSLTHHVLRRPVRPQLSGSFVSGFAADLNARWQERLDETPLFETAHYLSVMQRDPLSRAGAVGREARLASSLLDPAAAAKWRESQRKSLDDAVSVTLKTLHPYGARRLGMSESPGGGLHSEILGFLSELIHGEPHRARLSPVPLDRYLLRKRLFFGRDMFEIRGPSREDSRLGAMLTIKEYAPDTEPGALDVLLGLARPFQITQSACLVSRRRALRRLKLQRRQMHTAEDDAVTLEDQLGEAVDAVASGQLAFAEHHWSVQVTARTREELDEVVSEVTAALGEADVEVERSDLTLEADFWAQLPGNEHLIARRALVSSACLACFTGFQGFAPGKERGHWGAPLTVLETSSRTPYRFHLHHQDVGNFTVLGPNGSGKTVLLNALLSFSQGLRPAPRILLLDKDRGSEIFIRALGGAYHVIRPGEPTGLNPFARADSPGWRAVLCDLVACMAAPRDGRPLRASDRALIADAVATLYDSPPERRSLAALTALLEGAELRPEEGLVERLFPYAEGDRSWVFSGTAPDPFASHCVGFDLTAILSDVPVRQVLGGYLFQCMDAWFDGERTIGVLEEAWRFADDPLAAPKITDWFKTRRKRNGAVGFCSQNPEDVIGSAVARAVIAESPTQIWLPNPHAPEEVCRRDWGLTRKEWELVRTLPDTSRCFLLKQGGKSMVARFDLEGMEDLLTVLSGRERNVRRLDALRAELGEDPLAWLPRLMEDASHA